MFSQSTSSRFRTWLPWALLGAFLALIFALNTTFSFCSDDCVYGLTWKAPSNETFHWSPGASLLEAQAMGTTFSRADSLVRVWEANAMDGYRPVVHFFARLFTGWWGKGAFNVANTAVMGLLLLLLWRLSTGRWLPDWKTAVVSIGLVFLILCKGESYLWCAGSVNYLWAGSMTLGFCLMREKLERDGALRWWIVPMMFVAFFCGWAQEGFALPICFALGLWSLTHLRALRVSKVLLFAAYGLGALALCWVSARRFNPDATAHALSLMSVALTQIKIAVAVKGVWCVLLCLCFVHDRIAFLRRNTVELLVILGSILMISVVGFNGERSLWCANLFAILIVVREFKPPRWLAIGMVVAFVPLACVLLSLGFQIRANFDTMLGLFLRSEDNVTCHERVSCGPFARFFHQAIYTWQSIDGHGQGFGIYHGRNAAPIALGRELYDNLYAKDAFCVPKNRLSGIEGNFYTTPTANAIVMPLPEGDMTDWAGRSVTVSYARPTDFLSRVRHEIAVRQSPPVPHVDHPQVLTTPHGRYILIVKMPKSDAFIRAVTFGERQRNL